MRSPPSSFVLPDLHALTPWAGGFNPHYVRFVEEGAERAALYAHLPERKHAFFRQKTGELLAAYSFPCGSFERLRVIRDFIDLLYVVDLTTDDQTGKNAWGTGLTFYNSLRSESFDDGSQLCRLTQKFTKGLREACHPVCPSHYHRFVEQCREYTEATAKEAEYRERGIILDLETYEHSRRNASAVRCCLTLAGVALGSDLPDEIIDHPDFHAMHIAAADMVWWANDLYSYNMEQAMGHAAHNVLTVLMHSKHLDLQGAADAVGTRYAALIRTYLDAKRRLPSFGARADALVAAHAAVFEAWAAGNLDWSFRTPRYFGGARDAVRKLRIVALHRAPPHKSHAPVALPAPVAPPHPAALVSLAQRA